MVLEVSGCRQTFDGCWILSFRQSMRMRGLPLNQSNLLPTVTPGFPLLHLLTKASNRRTADSSVPPNLYPRLKLVSAVYDTIPEAVLVMKVEERLVFCQALPRQASLAYFVGTLHARDRGRQLSADDARFGFLGSRVVRVALFSRNLGLCEDADGDVAATKKIPPRQAFSGAVIVPQSVSTSRSRTTHRVVLSSCRWTIYLGGAGEKMD